jgi:SecD/SecF fusion protein
MQGKGLVKVFLVLIILVCLLQFAYFIPTNKIENAADDYAMNIAGPNATEASKEFKTARAKFLDSVSGQEIFYYSTHKIVHLQ